MKHPIVEALATIRHQRGLSQAALAIRMRKSLSAIRRFENDPGGRRYTTVEEVARALGMRIVLAPDEEER